MIRPLTHREWERKLEAKIFVTGIAPVRPSEIVRRRRTVEMKTLYQVQWKNKGRWRKAYPSCLNLEVAIQYAKSTRPDLPYRVIEIKHSERVAAKSSNDQAQRPPTKTP